MTSTNSSLIRDVAFTLQVLVTDNVESFMDHKLWTEVDAFEAIEHDAINIFKHFTTRGIVISRSHMEKAKCWDSIKCFLFFVETLDISLEDAKLHEEVVEHDASKILDYLCNNYKVVITEAMVNWALAQDSLPCLEILDKNGCRKNVADFFGYEDKLFRYQINHGWPVNDSVVNMLLKERRIKDLLYLGFMRRQDISEEALMKIMTFCKRD